MPPFDWLPGGGNNLPPGQMPPRRPLIGSPFGNAGMPGGGPGWGAIAGGLGGPLLGGMARYGGPMGLMHNLFGSQGMPGQIAGGLGGLMHGLVGNQGMPGWLGALNGMRGNSGMPGIGAPTPRGGSAGMPGYGGQRGGGSSNADDERNRWGSQVFASQTYAPSDRDRYVRS